MQVGATCTYTPTPEEQPMAQGKAQAAIVTDWNEETEQAQLIVFPAGGDYGYHKAGIAEGTVPGTFQQFPSGTTASAAKTPPNQKQPAAAESQPAQPDTHSHKGGRQY